MGGKKAVSIYALESGTELEKEKGGLLLTLLLDVLSLSWLGSLGHCFGE